MRGTPVIYPVQERHLVHFCQELHCFTPYKENRWLYHFTLPLSKTPQKHLQENKCVYSFTKLTILSVYTKIVEIVASIFLFARILHQFSLIWCKAQKMSKFWKAWVCTKWYIAQVPLNSLHRLLCISFWACKSIHFCRGVNVFLIAFCFSFQNKVYTYFFLVHIHLHAKARCSYSACRFMSFELFFFPC